VGFFRRKYSKALSFSRWSGASIGVHITEQSLKRAACLICIAFIPKGTEDTTPAAAALKFGLRAAALIVFGTRAALIYNMHTQRVSHGVVSLSLSHITKPFSAATQIYGAPSLLSKKLARCR